MRNFRRRRTKIRVLDQGRQNVVAFRLDGAVLDRVVEILAEEATIHEVGSSFSAGMVAVDQEAACVVWDVPDNLPSLESACRAARDMRARRQKISMVGIVSAEFAHQLHTAGFDQVIERPEVAEALIEKLVEVIRDEIALIDDSADTEEVA